jgi:hypothetical protein
MFTSTRIRCQQSGNALLVFAAPKNSQLPGGEQYFPFSASQPTIDRIDASNADKAGNKQVLGLSS